MNEKQFTLGTDYNGEQPSGWWMSEKLDGCRAYWDGRCFWTRGGGVINAPVWFSAGLPRFALDGELWAGRGNLQAARKAAQYGGEHFTAAIRFLVFDLPGFTGTWPERMATATTIIRNAPHARTVAFSVVTDARPGLRRIATRPRQGWRGCHAPQPVRPGALRNRAHQEPAQSEGRAPGDVHLGILPPSPFPAATMKELEPLAPSCVQNILTPVPDGYEIQMRGVTILAVDPKGEKPTLYFSFPAQSRGWRPYSQ